MKVKTDLEYIQEKLQRLLLKDHRYSPCYHDLHLSGCLNSIADRWLWFRPTQRLWYHSNLTDLLWYIFDNYETTIYTKGEFKGRKTFSGWLVPFDADCIRKISVHVPSYTNNEIIKAGKLQGGFMGQNFVKENIGIMYPKLISIGEATRDQEREEKWDLEVCYKTKTGAKISHRIEVKTEAWSPSNTSAGLALQTHERNDNSNSCMTKAFQEARRKA